MIGEDEVDLKKKLEKKFANEKPVINTALAKMEAELAFCQTKWEKGLMILYQLDELGYKLVKK